MYRKLSLVSVLLLASCVSWFETPTQKIQIATSNKTKASCRVVNKAGSWNVIAPGKVEVIESESPLKVYCSSKKTAMRGAKSVKPNAEKEYASLITVNMRSTKKRAETDEEKAEDMIGEDPSMQPLNMLREE